MQKRDMMMVERAVTVAAASEYHVAKNGLVSSE
jgi:hypothetical protein